MVDTLIDILEHLQQLFNHKEKKKAIVWAHNSHVGDASENNNYIILIFQELQICLYAVKQASENLLERNFY